MGNTRLGFSYPDGDDPVDVAKDLKQLAYELDHLINVECPECPECPGSEPEPPQTTVLVSNKELAWSELPTKDADNGSLKLVSSEVRSNVPVHAKTGKITKVVCPTTKGVKEVDETATKYETRAVYTYEADFGWDQGPTVMDGKDLPWLLDVLQFKNNQLKSGAAAFAFLEITELTALTNLDASNLTDLSNMFFFSPRFNQPLNWDTSNVTNMSTMFNRASAFDQPLNHFDTSRVNNFIRMFELASNFNQPLDNWDFRSVTPATSSEHYMGNMFNDASKFDQDLSVWCVENVTAPDSFAEGTLIASQPDKQPKWGVAC